MSVNVKEKIKGVVETALEYDIITEDEEFSGFLFDDEMIGKDIDSVISLLEKDKKLLVIISDLVKQSQDEDSNEEGVDEEDSDEGFDCA